MRYVVVSGRTPKGLPRYCACCLTQIGEGYTRDLDLKILYCTPLCFEVHLHETQVMTGAYEAPLLTYQKGGLR